jgi:hypothetical protein
MNKKQQKNNDKTKNVLLWILAHYGWICYMFLGLLDDIERKYPFEPWKLPSYESYWIVGSFPQIWVPIEEFQMKKIVAFKNIFSTSYCTFNWNSFDFYFMSFSGWKPNCHFESQPFFGHNLTCRSSNEECKFIFNIYISRL